MVDLAFALSSDYEFVVLELEHEARNGAWNFLSSVNNFDRLLGCTLPFLYEIGYHERWREIQP